MNDHPNLRAALNTIQGGKVVVDRMDLAELLHEYDLLVAAGSKKKESGYSAEFEQAWLEYPARPGNSKAAAYKAWKARLTAGVTVQEMIEGVRKYAAYVKIERTEPHYIKQAATFFGPGEHFSADWTPKTARQHLTARQQQQKAANQEALARLGGLPTFDPNVIDVEATYVP